MQTYPIYYFDGRYYKSLYYYEQYLHISYVISDSSKKHKQYRNISINDIKIQLIKMFRISDIYRENSESTISQ